MVELSINSLLTNITGYTILTFRVISFTAPDLADHRAESEAFYMNTTICLLVVLLVLIAGLILEEIVMRRNGTNPDDTAESSAKEKE